MTDWLSERLVILAGVVALVLAVLVALIGLASYGTEIVPHLLAGLVDVLTGIAVAALIIDRLTRSQDAKQWRRAHAAVAGILAATFVDAMRLLYVRTYGALYQVSSSRYAEFVDIASIHLTELRSTIEGFAVAMEPHAHTSCRKAAQRLSWIIHSMRYDPGGPTTEPTLFRLMGDTAEVLADFLVHENNTDYESARLRVEAAFSACESDGWMDIAPSDLDRFWALRLRIQDQLLAEGIPGGWVKRGVMEDVDNDTAMLYFIIDHRLLQRIVSQGSAKAEA